MKTILGSKRHHYMARVSIFLVTLSLITGMVSCNGGNGPDPYADYIKIYNWTDLDAIRNNLSSKYTLMNDLDSTIAGYTELASPTANEGKGWQQIGRGDSNGEQSVGEMFEGIFDGQGYEIRDLFINRPDEIEVGLFGFVNEGGTIKNISVMNETVIGNDSVGGLVGVNLGIVSNSYSHGIVSGNSSVGGLVGYNTLGNINDSCSNSSVSGNSSVGGLVGMHGLAGAVSNSYSMSTVSGESFVGGLVGISGLGGAVSNSYSTGIVSGESFVGGLVGGQGYFSTVSNAYSTSTVSGVERVGGLVGDQSTSSNVSNSYSTGTVSGESFVGGLVGGQDFSSNVSKSFWDTETSGQATSAGGTGKTTAEMKSIATFSGSTWDIVPVSDLSECNSAYIWNIVDDETYPFLNWQSTS